jgi:hypothetical protein
LTMRPIYASIVSRIHQADASSVEKGHRHRGSCRDRPFIPPTPFNIPLGLMGIDTTMELMKASKSGQISYSSTELRNVAGESH